MTRPIVPTITRRSSLALALGGLAWPAFRPGAAAAAGTGLNEGVGSPQPVAAPAGEAHGLSIFGDLALPPDFPHLPYVDPKAPKGGAIVLQISGTSGNQNFTTFNTLNAFILKGDGAAGMGLIFDTLMTGSADEPDALYGLVAKSVGSRRTRTPTASPCAAKRASTTARRSPPRTSSSPSPS